MIKTEAEKLSEQLDIAKERSKRISEGLKELAESWGKVADILGKHEEH